MNKDDPLGVKGVLRPVGITPGPQQFPNEIVEARQAALSRAARLNDLSEELAFYTPAVINLCLPLAPDPTPSFCEEAGEGVYAQSMQFSQPIFEDLDLRGDPSWNYVLYAMPRLNWDSYLRYMGSVCFQHGPNSARLRFQELDILDPLQADRLIVGHTLPDTVKIMAFVIESTSGCVYFNPINVGGIPSRPRLTRASAADAGIKKLRRFTQAWIDGHPNPYEAADEDSGETSQ